MDNYFEILDEPLSRSQPGVPPLSPACIDGQPLTMAYVPMQANVEHLYGDEQALTAGTLYPELDKPFTALKGRM